MPVLFIWYYYYYYYFKTILVRDVVLFLLFFIYSRAGITARRGGGLSAAEHHRQRHHQVQPSGQDPGPAPRPPPPRAGNVTTVLRTVQRGSAVVRAPGALGAPGPAVPVHPDPSKTQRSLVQRPILPPAPRQPGTPLVPANLMQPAAPPYLRPGSAPERAPAAVAPSCPPDKTVLAPKGQDYVLMDKLTASNGAPLDVIAGPRPGDPVPEGPHPVVGRLVSGSGGSGSGGRPSSLCRLTYSVMVRRCGPPPPLSTTSRAAPRGAAPRCTAGTAWGSRCHYRCPRRGLQLRGNSWVHCGDDLRWVGRPPVCAERARPHPAVVVASTEAPRRSCPVPALPEHGVASCRARPKAPDGGHHQDDDGDEESNDAQRLAEGSECTVSCRPPHQLLLIRAAADAANAVTPEKAVMRCGAGLWNVTGWSCARGEALDADLDGDISAVLADAGTSLQDEWDWRENSVMDPCLPNPCHSGGTCLRGPPKSKAVCQCRPGTEGDLCDRVLCRGTCLHGGRCLLLNGQPSCFCRAGYAGSRCQAPVRNVRYPVPTVPGVGSSGGGLPTLPTAPTTSSTSTTPTSPASAPLTKP